MSKSNLKQSFNDQPFKILKDERSQQVGSMSIGRSNYIEKLQCKDSSFIQSNDFGLGNETNMNYKKKDEKSKLKNNEKIVLQENWLANNIKKEQGIEKVDNNYKSEYDQVSFAYANDRYTYQANIFIKKIASDKHASDIACKYPLYTMMRAISKKFLFNELEIVFFAYILEENKWALSDEKLREHSFQMQDFLNINEAKDPLEYKCLLLYLVLNAYAVKFYLNPQEDMEMFSKHLDQIVGPFFKELFSYWSKKYASNSLKINPKKLNSIFRKLSAKPTDQNRKNQEDYNSLVDAIIQISPPYNNGKHEEKIEMKNEQKSEINNPQMTWSQKEDNHFTLYPSNLYQSKPNQDYQFSNANSTANYNLIKDNIGLGRMDSIKPNEIRLPLLNQQNSNRSDDMDVQIQKNLDKNFSYDFNLNRSSVGDTYNNKILQSFNFDHPHLINNMNQFFLKNSSLLPNQSILENDNNLQSNAQSLLLSKLQNEVQPKKPLNSSVIKQEDSAAKNKVTDKIDEEELPLMDGSSMKKVFSSSLFLNDNN